MTAFRVGEVVSVEFPFTDMQGRKRRPGVVLAIDSNDLLLARITTHEPRDPFDVSLEDWAAIGLIVCTVIGVGAGLYPAVKASRLDPIESLRFE